MAWLMAFRMIHISALVSGMWSGFPDGREGFPDEQETTQLRQFVWKKESEDGSSLIVPTVYVYGASGLLWFGKISVYK